MTSILRQEDQQQPDSKEDAVTKRHLKFLMYMVELAKKDPEWKDQLQEKARMFGEIQR